MAEFEEELDFLFHISGTLRECVDEPVVDEPDHEIPPLEELLILEQQQHYGEELPDDFFFEFQSQEEFDWESDLDEEFDSDTEHECEVPAQETTVVEEVEEVEVQPEAYVRDRRKKMTNLQRQLIVQQILRSYSNKKLDPGTINKAASEFQCSRQTISAIWNIALKQMESSQAINVCLRYKGKKGRKKKEIDLEKLRTFPLSERKNIRQVALILDVSSTTAWRLLKTGEIRSHSNAIKPFLTQEGIRRRLEFCISKVHFQNEIPWFEGFFNHVHIDEKWFYLTKEHEHYYLLPDEPDPHRTCKSTRFITKVMFMCAVARPRYSEEGVILFDGMIGIWPFTVIEPSQKKSKNRPRGVLETKPIQSITKDVTRRLLVDKLLPAIKNRWPDGNIGTIWVQQDNARPHIHPTDPEWVENATKDGWDIQLCYQPANSPDFNVLDLGFFRHLMSIQDLTCPKNTFELVEVVTESYQQLDPYKLNKVWLSLQYCMSECIKVKGSNSYKVPHASKDSMERDDELPVVIQPCINALRAARQWLDEGVIQPQEYMQQTQQMDTQDMETQDMETQHLES